MKRQGCKLMNNGHEKENVFNCKSSEGERESERATVRLYRGMVSQEEDATQWKRDFLHRRGSLLGMYFLKKSA